METFVPFKPLVENPLYEEKRRQALDQLDLSTIDLPIVDIIRKLAKLPYCFTLQSCWGHFLCGDHKGERNTCPLPSSQTTSTVEYRIAYVALCIDNSNQGRLLLKDLRRIPSIDPDCIQFGCAEWFWQRQNNSYVLQVEPIRHKTRDKVIIDFEEALQIEKARNKFFAFLKQMIQGRAIGKRSPGIPFGSSAAL